MTKAVLIKDFPDDVHKRAKLQAVTEEISLRELIIKAVVQYLEKESAATGKKGGRK